MKIELGDWISYKRSLHTKLGNRFRFGEEDECGRITYNQPFKLDYLSEGFGMVVGAAVILVDDLCFKKQSEDYGITEIPTGKKEYCYLVRGRLNKKAVYVRKDDIIHVNKTNRRTNQE